jgi:hypothetical protein
MYCVLLLLLYMNIGQMWGTTNKYKITTAFIVCLLEVRHLIVCLCVHIYSLHAVCFLFLHEIPSSLDISNVMKIDYLMSNYCWVSMLRRCCSRCRARSRVRVGNRDSRERD